MLMAPPISLALRSLHLRQVGTINLVVSLGIAQSSARRVAADHHIIKPVHTAHTSTAYRLLESGIRISMTSRTSQLCARSSRLVGVCSLKLGFSWISTPRRLQSFTGYPLIFLRHSMASSACAGSKPSSSPSLPPFGGFVRSRWISPPRRPGIWVSLHALLLLSAIWRGCLLALDLFG